MILSKHIVRGFNLFFHIDTYALAASTEAKQRFAKTLCVAPSHRDFTLQVFYLLILQ